MSSRKPEGAGRDDFFQLYELLHRRTAREVEAEPGWEDAKEAFDRLLTDATQKVERYQLRFPSVVGHRKLVDLMKDLQH